MGWDDVRVQLLAAGARVVKKPSTLGRTVDGDPVQLIGFEALRPRDLPPLADVAASLERRGFRLKERHESVVTFVADSTQASLTLTGPEPRQVLNVELEFKCTPSSISDLPRWVSLATSLADELHLSPMNRGSLTPYDDAEAAIRDTLTWREFSERFGWDS